MSISPFFLREFMRPLRLIENQMKLTDQLFQSIAGRPVLCRVSPTKFQETSTEYVEEDKEKLEIKLSLAEFKPEEISVRTLNGNSIEIQAKHEEKQGDSGFISREFIRRFVLPEGHDMKKMTSKLSNNGLLTIVAPKINPEPEENHEKIIPIKHENDA